LVGGPSMLELYCITELPDDFWRADHRLGVYEQGSHSMIGPSNDLRWVKRTN
jgi:hypothetical protein